MVHLAPLRNTILMGLEDDHYQRTPGNRAMLVLPDTFNDSHNHTRNMVTQLNSYSYKMTDIAADK